MRARIIAAFLAASVIGTASSAYADIVRGNGKVKTEGRSVSAFSSVSMAGSGNLRVHKGAGNIEITADSNILPYITTEVRGGELKIGFKPFTSIIRTTKLEFDVTVPSLEGVSISGSGDAYIDAFSGSSFSASVSGSGDIKAELDFDEIKLSASGSGNFDAEVDAEELEIRCSGSGTFKLVGSADKVDIDVSGSGDVYGRKLETMSAKVRVAGSGDVEIAVSDRLDAEALGSGDLRYWGNPEVKSRVAGSGRIKRAG